MKYVCELCGWSYDENVGCAQQRIAAGTPFSQLSEDFECPLCGCGKEAFYPADSRPDIRSMTMQSK